MNKKTLGHAIKSIALFLAIWIVAFPAIANAQVYNDPNFQAEQQARADVSSLMWMAGGCLFGVIAVAIGYLVPLTHAPSQVMMGKSPEYAAAFSAAYENKVKSLQGKNALLGCIAFTVIWVVLYFAFFAATASTVDTWDYYYY